MRVESVADALDMTANTVRTLIKRGELKTVRIGMRSLRVPVSEVEKFIARRSKALG